MTDDIIKMKLKEAGLSYMLTPKYFQILRESKMDSKAPKWFSKFEERIISRIDTLESKVDKNSQMISENKNMINEVITKVDKNTDMILKAHPEFKK